MNKAFYFHFGKLELDLYCTESKKEMLLQRGKQRVILKILHSSSSDAGKIPQYIYR